MKFIKKTWWVFLIALIIIGIGIFMIINNKEIKYDNINNLTISELEQKFNNKDTFILVITQTGCSHCEQFLPEFDELLKENNLIGYNLNITDLKKEELNILYKYINFSGTPTTIFINDGEEKTTLNRLVGYVTKTKTEQRLKALGFID